MNILQKNLIVTMSNGEKYSIPVHVIAMHRATNYMSEFGDDVQTSLNEDTLPLFESSEINIMHWARICMNWSDVEPNAKLLELNFDYEKGWQDGNVRIE